MLNDIQRGTASSQSAGFKAALQPLTACSSAEGAMAALLLALAHASQRGRPGCTALEMRKVATPDSNSTWPRFGRMSLVRMLLEPDGPHNTQTKLLQTHRVLDHAPGSSRTHMSPQQLRG